MFRQVFAAVTLILSLFTIAGCRSDATDSEKKYTEKTFPVKGKIISTDTTHVTLDHEAVPGFMDAMTMPYKLKDPSIVSELHPGDRISARIIVQQDDAGFRSPELDNIVILAQARPDYKPATLYNVPKPGDVVPDFQLLNQDNKKIHLSQFKGRVVIATFIYTRCPLPDYCPRITRNFAELDKMLGADPELYRQTHLLSISFDPTNDTPDILKTYGNVYAGKKQDFSHWEFVATPKAELSQITQYFGVGITSGENQTINHSLSTVVIGKDGRIAAWFPSNEWTTEEVIAAVREAARS